MKVKREDRICTICDKKVVGNEYHFLFECPSLQAERSAFYVESIKNIAWFMLIPDGDKVRFLLKKEMIKDFASWLEIMHFKRRSLVYKLRK